jgi:hypothetical protein
MVEGNKLQRVFERDNDVVRREDGKRRNRKKKREREQ